MDVQIRALAQQDLPEADRIFRLTFGTFLGRPDPLSFSGDADYVRKGWRAEPAAVLGAYPAYGRSSVGSPGDWSQRGVLGLRTNRLFRVSAAGPPRRRSAPEERWPRSSRSPTRRMRRRPGAAVVEAGRRFRKIRGRRDLSQLVLALQKHELEQGVRRTEEAA